MAIWLYPANTKFYDVLAAFEQPDTYWPMSSKVCEGDQVYIYLAAPHKQIAYLCDVIAVDIPADAVIDVCKPYFKGEPAPNKADKRFMQLKTQTRIPLATDSALSLAQLKPAGLNGMLMGPRNLNNNLPLLEYIQAQH